MSVSENQIAIVQITNTTNI